MIKKSMVLPALLGSTLILALSAQDIPAGTDKVAGPPPFPPYQMRDQVTGGDRLDSPASGAHLFSNRCGACHLEAGMGTNVLTKRFVMQGQSPEKGLLTQRTDLTVDYVKQVVREGKGVMPRLTPVDVTDSELELIADFLSGDRQ